MLTSIPLAAAPRFNQSSFQIYVRPQISSIVQDFRHILLLFPNYPNEALVQYDLVEKLERQMMELQVQCPRKIQASCLNQISALHETLRQMDGPWWTFQSHPHAAAGLTAGRLTGTTLWLDNQKEIWSLRSEVQATLLGVAAGSDGKRPSSLLWRKEVDEIVALSSLALIEFIPFRYREDFRSVWMNFVRPLQEQCLWHSNAQFLGRNLEALNFYWNVLNVRMTKRLKGVPDGMVGYLNAIQNRWNQVMRLATHP